MGGGLGVFGGFWGVLGVFWGVLGCRVLGFGVLGFGVWGLGLGVRVQVGFKGGFSFWVLGTLLKDP